MRYLRYAFLAVLAACLVTVALANSTPVALNLLPAEVALLVGLNASVSLPLFLVIFAGMLAGLFVGFVWEWLREARHRSEAARERRARQALEREVRKVRTEAQGGDEVLALLEDAGRAR